MAEEGHHMKSLLTGTKRRRRREDIICIIAYTRNWQKRDVFWRAYRSRHNPPNAIIYGTLQIRHTPNRCVGGFFPA